MKQPLLSIAIAFCSLTLISCNSTENPLSMDLSDKFILADTISYPVRIKNIDPDDTWANVRLKHLDQRKLVDEIFESVYSGKTTPYHYLTDQPLTIAQLKELEQQPEFSRDNVVELEFREKWWYDPDQSIFRKKVMSVLVAYAVFDNQDVRGLKAAFYFKTND